MLGLLASVFDGVLIGAVYGLAAMGITLIWGVMDVVNLTHGAMIVAGMFGVYLLSGPAGIPVYATLPIVLVGGFLIGVALYWISVHRVIGQPPLMSLLSTFSVNLVLIGVGTAVWGTDLFNVPVSLPGFSMGRYTFPGTHIMAAVLTVVIAGGCTFSSIGRASARRCAQCPATGRQRSWSAFRLRACWPSRSGSASPSPASPAC